MSIFKITMNTPEYEAQCARMQQEHDQRMRDREEYLIAVENESRQISKQNAALIEELKHKL